MIHHWLNLRLLVSVILSFTALSHAGPGIDAEGFIKARTDALASIAASTDPEDALFKTYKIYKEFLDRIGAQDLLTPLRKTRIDALTIKNQPEYGSARITLPLTGQGADNLRRKGVYFDCTIALDGGKVRSWNVRYVVPVMTLEELSKLFGKGRVFSKLINGSMLSKKLGSKGRITMVSLHITRQPKSKTMPTGLCMDAQIEVENVVSDLWFKTPIIAAETRFEIPKNGESAWRGDD